MSKKLVYCESCDRKFPRDELKWYPDREADEVGACVVFVGLCPFCHAVVDHKFGR